MLPFTRGWRFAFLFIGLVYCLVEARGEGDLYIYLCAAGRLGGGADIYTTGYILDQYHYYYSVFFALILKPFYTLPYYWVKLGWIALNMALFIHLFYLAARSHFLEGLNERKKRLFLLLLFIFSARFLHENIHASQITILIFWCCIVGLINIHKGKYISGSGLIALGINIKLLPVVLIPYLLYRGYFKAVFFLCLWLIFFYLSPAILIGHEYYFSLMKSWLQLINPSQEIHVLDVSERSFHSLSTLLATLLVKAVPDLYALPLKRNIMDISVPALANVLLVTRLFFVFLTFYFLRSRPFIGARNPTQMVFEISYILLLIPLLFPHQQHYAFLFIVPAFGLVLLYLIENIKDLANLEKRFLIVFLSVIYLACNLKILVGEFNRHYEHYKILTYGAILLIPLLMWVFRKRNKWQETPKTN